MDDPQKVNSAVFIISMYALFSFCAVVTLMGLLFAVLRVQSLVGTYRISRLKLMGFSASLPYLGRGHQDPALPKQLLHLFSRPDASNGGGGGEEDSSASPFQLSRLFFFIFF